MQRWPLFMALIPEGFDILEHVRKLNNIALFLKSRLHDEKTHEDYYNFINKLFSVGRKIFFSGDIDIVDIYNNNAESNTERLYGILQKSRPLQAPDIATVGIVNAIMYNGAAQSTMGTHPTCPWLHKSPSAWAQRKRAAKTIILMSPICCYNLRRTILIKFLKPYSTKSRK